MKLKMYLDGSSYKFNLRKLCEVSHKNKSQSQLAYGDNNFLKSLVSSFHFILTKNSNGKLKKKSTKTKNKTKNHKKQTTTTKKKHKQKNPQTKNKKTTTKTQQATKGW